MKMSKEEFIAGLKRRAAMKRGEVLFIEDHVPAKKVRAPRAKPIRDLLPGIEEPEAVDLKESETDE